MPSDTWTAPPVERRDTAVNADERTSLQDWLDFHRQTLLSKCAGLTAAQLKTPSVEPSKLTLLGLVRHMADVERFWFRTTAAQQAVDDAYCTEEYPDGDFDLVADADAEADFAHYRTECTVCDKAVASMSLDATFPTRRRATMNLRWVYVHMIEEYARHNGHADFIRERIDGVTGV